MKTFRQYCESEGIKMPQDKMIPTSWFNENDLPMIVECTYCTSTMCVVNALIADDGHIYCSSCVAE